MKTVILKQCANTFEADVVKGALKAAGIECFVDNPQSSAIWSALGPDTCGPVSISVLEDQFEAARAALEEKA